MKSKKKELLVLHINRYMPIRKESVVFKKGITLYIFLAVFLTGCAGPVKAIKATRGTALYEEGAETVIMLNRELRRKLYIIDQASSRLNDGRLMVKMRFFNKTAYTLKPAIQTLFKGGDGNITDETNWQTILIPANSYYYYEAKSLNDKAVTYAIKCK